MVLEEKRNQQRHGARQTILESSAEGTEGSLKCPERSELRNDGAKPQAGAVLIR
jgi:hypothetical protein